jgi:ribosomal 30S subunit maturation factor RimM
MFTTIAQLNLLDVVALKTDLPQHNLLAGQVGTIVEILATDVYEVEFSDDDGQTYAMLPLHRPQLLRLNYQPAIANTTQH